MPPLNTQKGHFMKPVTEFPTFKLVQALDVKKALTAEGKTPEEIQQSLGEKFKYEGDKLKYFINAIEVANANLDKLSRVIVVTLNEGESAPAKATKVEEHHYVPEFLSTAKPPTMGAVAAAKSTGKGGGKGGKGGGAPKSSPWGISPEEKEAKLAKAKKN